MQNQNTVAATLIAIMATVGKIPQELTLKLKTAEA